MKKSTRGRSKESAESTCQSGFDESFVLFFVFILALFLRLTFVCEWDLLPFGKIPLLDAASYDTWAKNIADGHWLRDTAFYQSPLYPYLLAALYKLFGPDALFAGIFNAFLGAGAATLISACALRIFGTPEALFTGILAALYQPMIFYAVPLMKESLALSLLAAFLLFSLSALKNNHMRDFVLSGLFLGLAVIVRGNAAFLLPAFLGIAFYRQGWAALRKCSVFFVVFCLCLFPSAIHNYAASQDFIPVNYADGFNLYIGHSPYAMGTGNYPPEVSTNPAQEELDITRIARKSTKENLTPAGVSAFWREKAFDFIWENPVRELTLVKNKFSAFWSNDEAFDNHNITFIKDNFDTVLNYSLPWFGLVSCLAAFGFAVTWRDKKKDVAVLSLFMFAYMISLLFFYVTDRYRLPTMVFLLPLAGAAIPEGIKLVQLHEYRRLAAGILAAALFLVLARIPIPSESVSPPAFNWGLLTIMYADSGQNREAVDALNKALALSPEQTGFLPIDKGAEAEMRLGNEAGALGLYNKATQLFPKASGAWFYFGVMKENKNDLKGALSAYQKAVDVGPSDMNSRKALARIYVKLGDTKRAGEVFQNIP